VADDQEQRAQEKDFSAQVRPSGALDMVHTHTRTSTSRRWIWTTAAVTLLAVWLRIFLPWPAAILLGVVAALATYWTGNRAVEKVTERFRQKA
jgi:hypothetical protein